MSPPDCSLREAVLAANARSGADIIELDTGPIHTLQRPPAAPDDPEGGDLDVSGPLTVVGRGSGRARIRGQEEDRLFHVEGAGRLTLRKLNLFDGETSNSGGAIRVETFGGDAKLRVDRSSFYDNVAGSDGGAIAADGDLPVRITRSDFAFNAAESDGGAILLDDGGSLKRVTLRSNTAGAGAAACSELRRREADRSARGAEPRAGRRGRRSLPLPVRLPDRGVGDLRETAPPMAGGGTTAPGPW